ncbi:cadherin 20 [Phyllostomus discolor]|uniref:Cadherin-20 n=1 Tax=Phyllostomus discolor TaxID=89673 RepID=A0A833Z9M1_9CHIR|nr:cadherin 20 [Phyllostomus discolor]
MRTSGRMSNAKSWLGLGMSLCFWGLMDLTTAVLSSSPTPPGRPEALPSDKPQSHLRTKRSWVWNQFFVLEEYTGTDPLYVGKLHSDMDRGDGSIKYILSGEGAGVVFTIDDTTGDIHAIQRLDREERAQYTLRAQALDRRTGRPMEPESEFIIKIQDINDNEPKFLDGPYVATVPEMSPVGTSVIQVTATDADDPTYGNSARVVYSILQGQPYFSVDSKSGVIRTALMNMDREAKEYYEVIIQAKDMGGQLGGLSGTTTVNITLSDVNDNPPRFPQKHYQMSVLESAPVSSTVGRVFAKDLDEGINAQMKYTIVDGDGTDAFDIHTDPNFQVGIITVKKPLSYESKKSYTLKVEGANPHLEMRFLNLGPFQDTTTVHISVEDVDEPPVFEPGLYFVEVPEDVAIGTTIQIMSAKDPDVANNSIRKSVVCAGTCPGPSLLVTPKPASRLGFMHMKTTRLGPPEMSVNTQGISGRRCPEAPGHWTGFCCMRTARPPVPPWRVWAGSRACPGCPASGSLPSSERILGQANKQGAQRTPPNVRSGSVVRVRGASSARSRYSIDRSSDPGRFFYVDITTGALMTARPLDREEFSWHNITILAMEMNNPSQVGSASVTVRVLDVNDNAPEFPGFYEAFVCENAKSGQLIQTVSAVDHDEPRSGQHFHYSLAPEAANNPNFTLRDNQDNTARVLTRRSGFRQQEQSVFYLPILIADNGQPVLSSTGTLTIQVCSCDDGGHVLSCSPEAYMLPVTLSRGALIAILACIFVLLVLVLLILSMRRHRKQPYTIDDDENIHENIVRYDDEGGGEEDTEAFDIAALWNPREAQAAGGPKTRQDMLPEIESLSRRVPQTCAVSSTVHSYVLAKLYEADMDLWAPPFDSLQTYMFEGDGSVAGSLSSLQSATSDSEQSFDFLTDWGPRFRKLAELYGAAEGPAPLW